MPQELANKELMLSVTAAWRDGNLDPLFAAIHPDIVWKATAPREFFRFGGMYKGIWACANISPCMPRAIT